MQIFAQKRAFSWDNHTQNSKIKPPFARIKLIITLQVQVGIISSNITQTVNTTTQQITHLKINYLKSKNSSPAYIFTSHLQDFLHFISHEQTTLHTTTLNIKHLTIQTLHHHFTNTTPIISQIHA